MIVGKFAIYGVFRVLDSYTEGSATTWCSGPGLRYGCGQVRMLRPWAGPARGNSCFALNSLLMHFSAGETESWRLEEEAKV